MAVIKYIKNTSGSTGTWVGQEIANNSYYQIQTAEEYLWANNSTVLTDIGSGDLTMAKTNDGNNDISDVATGVNWLRNSIFGSTDADGTPLARTKITQAGWHYHMYSFEFQTAKLNSVVDLDQDGNTNGFVSIKYYNSSDVELVAGTQTELDLNCVKTVIDWEPTWDYEIIGGQFRQIAIPGSNIRMHVVAVPDLTEGQGGSKPFLTNVNIRYIGNEDHISTDGRTSKRMDYDATYHTNKLRFIFEHDLLTNHGIQIMLELFRA